MTAWVRDWVLAFSATLAIEAAIATPILQWLSRRQLRELASPHLGRAVLAVALANLATHPLVWFLFPGLALPYPARVGLSEAFALGVEAAAYGLIVPDLGPRRAMFLSAVANGASLALGWALRGLHVLT